MGVFKGSAILLSLAALPVAAIAAPDDIGNNRPYGLSEALTMGHPTIQLRPRYNRISESDRPLLAEGGTVRAVAGWRSAPWLGLRMTVEAIHTDYLGRKRFNADGAQFATSPYPLLPDPRHTGLNQAHVEYASGSGLQVRLGRQLVRMDNQRWVSDNDFRQIPQLFDGALATYAGVANAELTAGYFARIRDTSGEVERVKLSLFRAAWNPAPGHSLAAYAHFHDQPVTVNFTGFANSSYRIAGARAEGAFATGAGFEVPYVLEAAQQKPYAGGDARVDAGYWRVGAGLAAAAWTVRADVETRGSNRGLYGLQAPLTDFYAFNGWTLHFFTVPRQGLRDRWVTARYAVGRFTFYGEAHRFRSDFGGLDLGRENDLGITFEALPNALVRLQHARYEPGDGLPAPAIRKTWLTLDYTF